MASSQDQGQRRNAVRFELHGQLEMDRLQFSRLILQRELEFTAAQIDYIFALPGKKMFEVIFATFHHFELCVDRFRQKKLNANQRLENISLTPLSERDARTLTVIMYSERVTTEDIQTWLQRFCYVNRGYELTDQDGVKTGARRFFVKLRRDTNNGVCHVPSTIQLGQIRGQVFYQGQPKECRKCGSLRHLAAECSTTFCKNCQSSSHTTRDCDQPMRCNLCNLNTHTFKDCPHSYANRASQPRRQPSADQPAINLPGAGQVEPTVTESTTPTTTVVPPMMTSTTTVAVPAATATLSTESTMASAAVNQALSGPSTSAAPPTTTTATVGVATATPTTGVDGAPTTLPTPAPHQMTTLEEATTVSQEVPEEERQDQTTTMESPMEEAVPASSPSTENAASEVESEGSTEQKAMNWSDVALPDFIGLPSLLPTGLHDKQAVIGAANCRALLDDFLRDVEAPTDTPFLPIHSSPTSQPPLLTGQPAERSELGDGLEHQGLGAAQKRKLPSPSSDESLQCGQVWFPSPSSEPFSDPLSQQNLRLAKEIGNLVKPKQEKKRVKKDQQWRV